MENKGNIVLIKNGILVTPDKVFEGDLLVIGETIAKVDDSILLSDEDKAFATLIDAKGKYVLPGGIDVHTHFNLDIGVAVAQDDFYTGTVAAAMGGTTTIVDHPGFGPKGCSIFHQIDTYHEYAKENAVIDYSFHGVLQHLDEKIIADIPKLADQGITSMKAYMTYDFMFSDDMLLTVLRTTKEAGVLIAIHAEDDSKIHSLRHKFLLQGKKEAIYHAKSRPVTVESDAIKKVIALSHKANNAPVYIVHLSTKEGLLAIKKAKEAGQNIIAETCPQYLLLDESLYTLPDHQGLKYIMSPPLRTKENQNALWEGLFDQTLSVIATDHCPFDFKLKKKLAGDDFSKCPGGVAGVEARVPLIFSKGVLEQKMSLQCFARVMAENPAKIMGLYPKKGVISKGSDADIIILDPEQKVTISQKMLHENVDYTPYEGINVMGWPVLTMVRGSIIVKDSAFIGKKGYGKFIKRKKALIGADNR
ncbi:MAG: dihydropyrimidinase [Desulfobacteraceae bacterium]|nr:dihydropyrimidinase [Desulfobacteraceae bacterium]